MAFINFGMASTLAQAKASLNKLKVFFPTDSSAIVVNGREFGGVTKNDLNAALGEIRSDVADTEDDMNTLRAEVNAKQLEIGAVQTDAQPTENSGNHLTSGAIYTALQNVTEKVIEMYTTPVVIAPNNLYKLGGRAILDVSFLAGQAGVMNEYMFEFTVTSDDFALTLPLGVKWIDDMYFENGYTYQVSVVNNLAIAAGWEAEQ